MIRFANEDINCEYGKITYYRETTLNQEEIDAIVVLLNNCDEYGILPNPHIENISDDVIAQLEILGILKSNHPNWIAGYSLDLNIALAVTTKNNA